MNKPVPALPLAVIDNSVLRNLHALELLQHLNMLFERVYLPREVEKEFLQIADPSLSTQRFQFLIAFAEKHSSWFVKCQVYNDEQVDIFMADSAHNKLDRGEAEAAVQKQSLPESDSIRILCDEKNFRKCFAPMDWPIRGTLKILAIWHQYYGICDYESCIETLVANQQRFSKPISQQVWLEVHSHCAQGLPALDCI